MVDRWQSSNGPELRVHLADSLFVAAVYVFDDPASLSATVTVLQPPTGVTPDAADVSGYTTRASLPARGLALRWLKNRDDEILYTGLGQVLTAVGAQLATSRTAADNAAGQLATQFPTADPIRLRDAVRLALFNALPNPAAS